MSVRHAEHSREPTGGRRSSARPNCLLPFLARFAQVDVDIDESRRHDEPGHVNGSLRGVGLKGTDGDNDPIMDANVRGPINSSGWVDDPPPPKKHLAVRYHGHSQKNRLAVQVGPGDGSAVERLVMNCVTNSLDTGDARSIGGSRKYRQKARSRCLCHNATSQQLRCAD